MGEQQQANKKEEAPKVEEEAEKKEEEGGGGGEEKKQEAAPAPAPVILAVELHCTGCAKRIKRCILRCRGVEGVEVDMGGNQVTVKGIVDPQALCARLQKKTMRNATVISPPPPDDKPEPPPPPAADSQPEAMRTVELLVNMHCQPCADQLLKKILKMRGVHTAEANLSAGKLTVTGTMSDDKIIEYIHRRTGKLATVVPPPAPDPPEQPHTEEPNCNKEEAQAQAQAGGDGEKKPPVDDGDKKEEKLAPEADAEKKEPAEDVEGVKKPAEEAAGATNEKKEEGAVVVDGFPPEEMMKRLVYWPYGGAYKQYPEAEEVMMARRMATMNMMAHPPPAWMPHWMPPPPPPPAPAPMYYSSSYMPAPAPQLFSDENPNACVIS